MDTRSHDDHWTNCRHPETAHNTVSSYDCTFDDLELAHQRSLKPPHTRNFPRERAAIIWQKIKRPRNAGAELPKWRCGVPTRRHYSPSRRTHPVRQQYRPSIASNSGQDASEFSCGGDRGTCPQALSHPAGSKSTCGHATAFPSRCDAWCLTTPRPTTPGRRIQRPAQQTVARRR